MALSRIDDFSDISAEEKQLMKLWTTHIFTFPPYGDRLMPVFCQRFVQRFATVIVERNLRHNLLAHLLHLWDAGLLLFEEVERLMEAVDRLCFEQVAKAGQLALLPSFEAGEGEDEEEGGVPLSKTKQ